MMHRSLIMMLLASIMISITFGMTHNFHGVPRELKTDYTHIDPHRVANEFDLLEPASFRVGFEVNTHGDSYSEGGSEYLNTDTFLRGSPANGRKLSGPVCAAGRTYTISVVNGTSSALGIDNGDIIRIEYTSSAPAVGDWIAAYSPAGANISETVPVKWAYADVHPTYASTGLGYLYFNFTNLREDVSFYFFTGGIYNGSCAVQSTLHQGYPNVYFNDPNEPLRPRIVPSGDPDIFKLLWNTNNSADPTLEYGTSSGSYSLSVSATTSRLTKDMMCTGQGSHATGSGWRDTGAIHTAKFTGMKSYTAGTKIYYRFGDNTANTWSQEYIFHVPPQAGQQPPNRPTTAILFCDLGRGSMDDAETWNEYGRPAYNTSRFAAARAQAGEIDAVFHGGDLSYARGYMAVWDFYMDQMGPLTSSALYFSTVGNHESDWPLGYTFYNVSDSGGECGVACQTMYPMPTPASTNEPWWSYDVGIMHFVGMSTEHNFTYGSPQYAFIESDLAAVNRTLTPWVIFNGHRPMYVSSTFDTPGMNFSDDNVMNLLIDHIEPLLQKYQVNIAFWGHNHVYTRMSAVSQQCVVSNSEPATINGQTWNVYDTPQSPVHLLVGNAGATFSNNSLPVNPDWVESLSNFYGYNVVTAVNSSYFEWVAYNSNEHDEESVYERIVVTQNVSNWGGNWTLPESTIACINSKGSSTTSDENNFFLSSGFYVLVGVVSAICIFALAYYLYQKSLGKLREETTRASQGDRSGEDYWRNKAVEDSNTNNLRSPLTMDIQDRETH